MTLTAAQLTRLRQLSGGVVATSEPDYLTDAQLQAEYASAGNDFDKTVVYVLRLRVGMTAGLTDRSYAIEQTSESLSQRHQQLKALLDEWERRVGLAGAALQAGALDMGLDEDNEDA